MTHIWTSEELTRLESKVWADGVSWPVERAEIGDLICSYRSVKAERSPDGGRSQNVNTRETMSEASDNATTD